MNDEKETIERVFTDAKEKYATRYPHTDATIQYRIGEKELPYTVANSVLSIFCQNKIIPLNLT